jgi:UDP-galactose transporter B1
MRWRAPLAIGAMYAGFLIHFTIQESLLPHERQRAASFQFPSALLFWVDAFNAVASFIFISVSRVPRPPSPFPYLLVALPQQIGLAASNYAVRCVDYPTLSLLKSAKPIAVMLCSVFVFRASVPRGRVVVAAVGLAVFGFSGNFGRCSLFGIGLAAVSLLSDAVYVPIVDRLKAGEGGPFLTMFYAYSWSTALVFCSRPREIIASFRFLRVHMEIVPKLCAFAVTGCLAHLALFTAIGMCDGIVVAIATTTRKFVTILLSSIIFRHSLKVMQWIGVVIVFSALGLEIWFKYRSQHEKSTKKANVLIVA